MIEVANPKYQTIFYLEKVLILQIKAIGHKVGYFYLIEKSNLSKLSIVFRNPKDKSIFAFQPKLFI